MRSSKTPSQNWREPAANQRFLSGPRLASAGKWRIRRILRLNSRRQIWGLCQRHSILMRSHRTETSHRMRQGPSRVVSAASCMPRITRTISSLTVAHQRDLDLTPPIMAYRSMSKLWLTNVWKTSHSLSSTIKKLLRYVSRQASQVTKTQVLVGDRLSWPKEGGLFFSSLQEWASAVSQFLLTDHKQCLIWRLVVYSAVRIKTTQTLFKCTRCLMKICPQQCLAINLTSDVNWRNNQISTTLQIRVFKKSIGWIKLLA